jgi:hypothetical protein
VLNSPYLENQSVLKMDEKVKQQLSAMDCRQYYQLGLDYDQDQAEPVGPILSDEISECGSEDVETVPHRYDPPTRLDTSDRDPRQKTGFLLIRNHFAISTYTKDSYRQALKAANCGVKCVAFTR